MKFIRVEARFSAPDVSIAEELICSIFFSFNLKGVVCDVPVEEPDEGFGTQTLEKPEFLSITGFFPAVDASEPIVESIRREVKGLAGLNIKVDIFTSIVDEEDWADAWKDFFEVTPVTRRIIVKPEWKPYAPKENDIVIHLDPGMAFGTGTHPTTAMCIQLIEDFLRPGDSFLDVGTGSGILMVAAAKLGAGEMTGIDTDEVAVRVSRENLEKNQIPQDLYTIACTTLDKTYAKAYDIIAANIIAQVIVDICPQLCKRMTPRTTAVLSGIIVDRLGEVEQALKENGLSIIDQKRDGEWVALAVKK